MFRLTKSSSGCRCNLHPYTQLCLTEFYILYYIYIYIYIINEYLTYQLTFTVSSAGIHKISKGLRVTSKFLAPERWHAADSKVNTHMPVYFTVIWRLLLGARALIITSTFRRLRKIAKSGYWLRYVCLSEWNNSAPTIRIFMKFYICVIFENLPKNQVSLKSAENKGYFTWRPIHIFYSSFQMKVVEKIKTHFRLIFFFLRKSFRLWDNVEDCTAGQATDGNIIRRVRICMLDT
jgi:hypothetical protein